MSDTLNMEAERNCWTTARADRLTFLLSARDYFRAFFEAAQRAERSICLVGWDLHSQVELVRGEDAEGLAETPTTLGGLLKHLARQRPELEIRLLEWDSALIYTMEREKLTGLEFAWQAPGRIAYASDGCHPPGGAHHQKIVVIDDALAFIGGTDLTINRWDTLDHEPGLDTRRTPSGDLYAPYHDIQVMLSGDAARRLGELVRERWERACGQPLDAAPSDGDPWPERVAPDVRDVQVAIARTVPAWNGDDEAGEIKQLVLDAIAAARHTLYIETQYLTSETITDALCERLEDADGPEVVIITPRWASGWIEKSTMSVQQVRRLRQLIEADAHKRMLLLYPEVDGTPVYVHTKMMVVDDLLARVGSANLSNRAFTLDTECDVALLGVGPSDDPSRRAIVGLAHRLLGMHLGLDPEEVAAGLDEAPSLRAFIDQHQEGRHRLVEAPNEIPEWLDELMPERPFYDPPEPSLFHRLANALLPSGADRSRARPFLGLAALLLLLLGLAAAWRWTPLSAWASPEQLAAALEPMRDGPWGGLAVVGGFVVLGLLGFPVTVMILGGGAVLGAWPGVLYVIVGALLSSAATYGIGYLLGRDAVTRLAGDKASAAIDWVQRRGLWTVAALRVVPVAPFSVLNMVCGAFRIPFWRYLLGTLLGMGPGIVAMVVFGDQLIGFFSSPSLGGGLLLLVIAAAILGAGAWLRRRLRASSDSNHNNGDDASASRSSLLPA